MFLSWALTLFAIAPAKGLGRTIQYHTEGLDSRNYQTSFGKLCNDSLCFQKREELDHRVLPLHEIERRQRVASLQRLYIASQHYQPHIEQPSSTNDTLRVIYNDTCIRCPSRQLARVARNQRLAKVPAPKLRFCARLDDFVTNFPLMVLQGPLMGSHVAEGEYTITFKTLVPLPAKTCRYTLRVFSLRCPTLPLLSHGSFHCTNENLWGSRCIPKCDNEYSLKDNRTTPYKCVKRRREAVWKAPSVVPQCVGQIVTTTTTTTTSTTTVAPRKPTYTAKRRVACRWPRTPQNGWTTCGQRGRWKKRLFVKSNLPCYRGCSRGFLASVPLGSSDKNRVSCVGGTWVGFKEFECVPQPDNNELRSNECRRVAERTPNVRCRKTGEKILCALECPRGSAVPRKLKSRAEIQCDSAGLEHNWPPCQKLAPPVLVEGCENVFIKNSTFPVEIHAPIYRSSFSAGEVEVTCNATSIESYGKFPVACTARDTQLFTEASCNFQVFSQATSCKPFTPGNHVIPKCMTPTEKIVDFPDIDSFPVNSLCEFICSSGFVISSSRIVDSFTECTEDGVWSLDNFDLCRPQVKPKQIIPCRNLTITTTRIPEDGVDFETGAYEDVFHERIEPVCVPPKVLDYGTSDIECHFDDIELRTRVTCDFKVTVQINPQGGYP